MKMKRGAFLALFVILLSYSFVGAVHAALEDCEADQVWQNNECVSAVDPPKNDLNLQTDKVLYRQGGVVVITGMIHNIENLSTGDVAIIVRAPDNNIVTID